MHYLVGLFAAQHKHLFLHLICFQYLDLSALLVVLLPLQGLLFQEELYTINLMPLKLMLFSTKAQLLMFARDTPLQVVHIIITFGLLAGEKAKVCGAAPLCQLTVKQLLLALDRFHNFHFYLVIQMEQISKTWKS